MKNRAGVAVVALLGLTACGGSATGTTTQSTASSSRVPAASGSASPLAGASGVAAAVRSTLGLDQATATGVQDLVGQLSCSSLTQSTSHPDFLTWLCNNSSAVVSVQAYKTREAALANARGFLDGDMVAYVADAVPVVIGGKSEADVLAATGGSDAYSKGVAPDENTSTAAEATPAPTNADTSTEPITDDPASVDPIESAAPEVPTEYESALTKAQAYSDQMHMSKKRLYQQLTSSNGEGFTAKAATYAIDHVDADWNANALAKAEEYQEQMSMSPAAIRRQLVSSYGEQFTEAQADYAIKHLS